MVTINWEGALGNVSYDVEFLEEVLQDLLTELITAEASISEGIEELNLQDINRAAHRIKGSSSYLYCEDIRIASQQIKDACSKFLDRNVNIDTVLMEVKEMFEIFQRRHQELIVEVAIQIPILMRTSQPTRVYNIPQPNVTPSTSTTYTTQRYRSQSNATASMSDSD